MPIGSSKFQLSNFRFTRGLEKRNEKQNFLSTWIELRQWWVGCQCRCWCWCSCRCQWSKCQSRGRSRCWSSCSCPPPHFPRLLRSLSKIWGSDDLNYHLPFWWGYPFNKHTLFCRFVSSFSRTKQEPRRNMNQLETVPMAFTREMAVHKRQNRHDIFISRIHPWHILNSTFWDLSSEPLFAWIRVREGPFQQFCNFSGPFLSYMGPQYPILPCYLQSPTFTCCDSIEHMDLNKHLQKLK